MSDHDESVETIPPGSIFHTMLKEQSSKRNKSKATTKYNDIALAYNGAELGAYIKINDSSAKFSNLEKVFSNRGLLRDEDYQMFRPTHDANGSIIHRYHRPVMLCKITMREMRVV